MAFQALPESVCEEATVRQVGIGIIGCGNISEAYLGSAPKFPVLNLVAVADINMDAARAKADAHKVEALTVERCWPIHALKSS